MTRDQLRKRYAAAIDKILDGPNGLAYRGVLPDAVLAVRDDELAALRDELERVRARLDELARRYGAANRLHGNDDMVNNPLCETCRVPHPCPTVLTLDKPTQEGR